MQLTWSTTDDNAVTHEGNVFIFAAYTPESLLLTVGKKHGGDQQEIPMVPGLRIAITE